MALSQDERDKIREIEILKKEIGDELRNGPTESWAGKLGRDALLLMIAFGLTTVAGGCLTSRWKQLEWTNQQKYLYQQRDLDKRYRLIDDLVKSVAETNTAAEDMLSLYSYENWTAKDIEERRNYWRNASRNWRISSKMLATKLGIYFGNSRLDSAFNDIVLKRRELGNIISNLPPRRKNLQGRTRKKINQANSLVNEIKELLQTCGSLMAEDLKRHESMR